jgi:PEP-CTERM motif
MVSLRRSTAMVLPTVCVLSLGLTTPPASGAVISVPENSMAIIGHRLTNTRPTNYLFGNVTGLAWTETNFDPDDLVSNVTVANNNCSGAFVAPGATCTFGFRVTTKDTSNIDDADVGIWDITAKISAQWFDITVNRFRTDTFAFKDTVNVTDPTFAPEPSSILLLGLSALGAIGLAAWRRRAPGLG